MIQKEKELIKTSNRAYPRGQPEKSTGGRNPELNNSGEYLKISIFDCQVLTIQRRGDE